MIDVLSLQDAKQGVAAVQKLAGGLSALSDVYLVSSFRLPQRLGGVLLGLYRLQDNRKYLEVAVMGKINKGRLNRTGGFRRFFCSRLGRRIETEPEERSAGVTGPVSVSGSDPVQFLHLKMTE